MFHLVYRGHGATAGLGEAVVPGRGLLPAARAPHQAPGDSGGPHLATAGQVGAGGYVGVTARELPDLVKTIMVLKKRKSLKVKIKKREDRRTNA